MYYGVLFNFAIIMEIFFITTLLNDLLKIVLYLWLYIIIEITIFYFALLPILIGGTKQKIMYFGNVKHKTKVLSKCNEHTCLLGTKKIK